MKQVLVLGATSAIAEQVVRCFAAEGDALFLVGRDPIHLDAIAADARVRGAAEVRALAADLADLATHEQVLAQVRAACGHCDIVLVAYGVLGEQRLAEVDFVEAERILRTNYTSVVSLLTPLANEMADAGHGIIAVISSVAGERGRQSNYVYGSSKGALSIFLQGLRNRLHSRGVTVLTIKPGLVRTPMTAHLPQAQGPLTARAEPVGRAIHRAILRRRDVVYTPAYWALIMAAIRAMPECIFKRLKL